MTFITLDEAKAYLRVDSSDEDTVISSLLAACGHICVDVARLTEAQWDDIDSEKTSSDLFKTELTTVRDTMRVAILYALGYMFEHREEADHNSMMLTLRSLLFAIREGV